MSLHSGEAAQDNIRVVQQSCILSFRIKQAQILKPQKGYHTTRQRPRMFKSPNRLSYPPCSEIQRLGYDTTQTMFDDLRGGLMVRTNSYEAGIVDGGRMVDFAINAESTVWVCK